MLPNLKAGVPADLKEKAGWLSCQAAFFAKKKSGQGRPEN
jgi:hypothetical protein